MKSRNFTWAICLALVVVVILTQTGQSVASSSSSTQCKELNQINCYMGRNEGYFCNSKDQTKTQSRWYYDRGVCKKFNYKGCYGNRNRFCTLEACERRCR